MAETFMGSEVIRMTLKVKKIFSSADDTGFVAMSCRSEDTGEKVKVVGKMFDVHEDFIYVFEGSWVTHPTYGKQFHFDSYDEVMPTTVEGIYNFLSSGLIKGVGETYARKIVDKFGVESLDIIEDEPERLLEVSGIGQSKLKKILESWASRKEIKQIMFFFKSYNLTTNQATRIYKQYGKESISKVKENPYRLADDIWGFGFKTVDQIALKMNFGYERFERLRSGILYTLNEMAKSGHCFMPWDDLLVKAVEYLGVDVSLLSVSLDQMVADYDVCIETIPVSVGKYPEGTRLVYLKQYYFAENSIADRLHGIARKFSRFSASADLTLSRVLANNNVSYDPVQMQAIRTALSSKVFVLTGGPGTGKTTTVNGIIAGFAGLDAKILLAAPTGRAAKRMEETTHCSAVTIHRLLGVRSKDAASAGVPCFLHNRSNKLEGDVLIVDECSMIDVSLMSSLLDAVPDSMIVILVGDVDQLPSVGAGNVLRDIIDSDCFPVVRLTRIFRQGDGSGIVNGAKDINEGRFPADVINSSYGDFFFIDVKKLMESKGIFEYVPSEYAERAAEEIVNLVSIRLPYFCHVSPSEIQVLSPMHKYGIGVSELNLRLQARLNPGDGGVSCGRYIFREKDRVMQLRNNYDKNVFNGDVGVIRKIDSEERIVFVDFDDLGNSGSGKLVEYDFSELNELSLAYATTIHKSQGSEYQVVVMPVMKNHWVMLQRNLIYTGVTRAIRCVVLVGTLDALKHSIRNSVITKRNTLLKERLRDWAPRKRKRRSA